MHLIIFKIRAHLTIVGEERRLQSYLMANKGNATTTFHKPIRRHALKGLLRKWAILWKMLYWTYFCALKLCKNVFCIHSRLLVERV